MPKLAQYKGITGLDTDLKLNKPQLKVDIDREKAAALGVSMETIGHTLETLMGGRDVTRYKREGKQYDVVVQVEDDKRRQPSDLTSIYVRGNGGELHQLSNLVSVREAVAPKELNHFNKLRAAIINGNVGEGASLKEALSYIDKVVKEELPPGQVTDLDGESREFQESGQQAVAVLVLALIFIYLVLSAQFESFVGPFVIMFTVPLAWAGAMLIMYINTKIGNGGTLNIYSKIGLVMLVGLITKHGILIVEFANQLRRSGHGEVRGGGGSGHAAVAADLDDLGGDGARRGAAGAVARGRRRGAAGDRLGHRGRHSGRNPAYALRDPGYLYGAGTQGAHPRRGARRGARPAGASAAGRAVALKASVIGTRRRR